ncbi:hypothetical protein Rhe02_49850 [Rhizocola hellebori]|uniref:Uncharacterized protein n=1 Tax=Rhizocola hellebori TaxID=1392758 RepID=A0A8J3QA19_9ACTN|nr:hypothetical protein [Rhizocola hellebori]GIH06918.1 hypothetical protein Rhe02_49850 [Rhizocola hellebori]
MTTSPATAFLEHEARALLTRLDRVRPFVINETMVLAAAPLPAALSAVEPFLLNGRRVLRRNVEQFLEWLRGPGRDMPASEQQHRFTAIRIAFNDVLSQFDLFTEAITQRSEHQTGVWLSGLDMLATDALRLRQQLFDPPPLICYLARGPGAAIRRARTRLPGGASSPAALIRVPRERMIGHGIGSSLIHEVGHQGAALLSLVETLRPALLDAMRRAEGAQRHAWRSWAGWISEIAADLWSVAKLGVGSTLGLIGVVSLPRWFVFRPSGADPHPVPWIRVQVSAAIGAALYPDPQWTTVSKLWSALYPLERAPAAMRGELASLVAHIPEFVGTLLDHRSAALRGERLGNVLWMPGRQRSELLARYASWQRAPQELFAVPPALAFAVLGQARGEGLLSPEQESRLLGAQLTRWAVRGSLDTSVLCAQASRPVPVRAPALAN